MKLIVLLCCLIVVAVHSLQDYDDDSQKLILFSPGSTSWLGSGILRPIPTCNVTCRYAEASGSVYTTHLSLVESEDTKRVRHKRSIELSEEYKSADAYVWHLPASRPPMSSSFRLRKGKSEQIWVGFTMEAMCDGGGGKVGSMRSIMTRALDAVDVEMSYRLEADICASYVTNKPRTIERFRSRVSGGAERRTDAMMAVFISNCGARSGRLRYLDELQRHGVTVHSYGACRHNRDSARNERNHVAKLALLRDYKFYFAAENTRCASYVTEKIYDAFAAGAVPVYLGAPNIRQYLPGKRSALLVDDYASPRHLAEHMLALAANDTLYDEYLKWREQPFLDDFEQLLRRAKVNSRCALCQMIHSR
jgi:Glycosyltransferase family 10 (fucosyltransferase) C-term